MPDIFISENSKKEIKNNENAISEKGKTKPSPSRSSKKRPFRPLAAYLRKPRGVNFEIRDKEEKIELLLRAHPIVNLKWILIALAMCFAPLILKQFPILDFLPGNFKFIAVLGWYLIVSSYVLESFLTWYFNVYIVTDERIVDVDFVNLIYKEITDADIEKIQDVTYTMSGVIRTIFNFGDVLIQTASEVPRFEFTAVAKPSMVAKILQDLRIEEKQEAIEGRVR